MIPAIQLDEPPEPSRKKKYVTYAYRIAMVRDKTIQYDMEVSNALLGAKLICKTIAACGQDDREHLIVVMLNSKNRVMGTNLVSMGSINSSPVFVREVFKPAITASASALVIGHNHPSGILAPSREDILVTKRILAVAKILDMTVHDHLIVDTATRGYYSFCDNGMLADLKSEATKMIDRM
ncbi:MAG: JAB domain-containing protein [Thermodesulfobacteriota bacterium]